jgi:pimeloyl-ACP methyl ester carboxylesterase
VIRSVSVQTRSFYSAAVQRSVEYRAITPSDFSRGLPLVLVLHGAGSSSAVLDSQLAAWSEVWATQVFYIDRPAGDRWESAIAEDFPAELETAFGVDLRQMVICGASMGGCGALKIAFDCGDDDCFALQDGAEYLHRQLWDLQISHDYHLVQAADHVGPLVSERESDLRRFLARALRPDAVDGATASVAAELRLSLSDSILAARRDDPTTTLRCDLGRRIRR